MLTSLKDEGTFDTKILTKGNLFHQLKNSELNSNFLCEPIVYVKMD